MISTRYGSYLFKAGQPQRARDFMLKSIAEAHACRCGHATAFALRSLAVGLFEHGFLDEAIKFSLEAHQSFLANKMMWQAGAELGNLAEFYLEAGDTIAAERYARRALSSAQIHRDWGERQRIALTLGTIYRRSGQIRGAHLHLSIAHQLSRLVQNDEFEASVLVQLIEMALEQKQLTQAERLIDRLRIVIQNGRAAQLRPDCLRLEALSLAERSPSQAANSMETAVQEAARLGSTFTLARILQSMAALAIKNRAWDEARRNLETALSLTESIRDRLPTSFLRSRFTDVRAALYDDAMLVLSELYRRNPLPDLAFQALQLAERFHLHESSFPALPELRALETRLNAQDRARKRKLEDALAVAMADLERLDSPETRAAVVRADSQLTSWAIESLAALGIARNQPGPSVLSQADVQALAGDQKIQFVRFWFGPRLKLAWVITQRQIRWIRLHAIPSDAELRLFPRLLSQRPRGIPALAYQPVARSLFQKLIDPLRLDYALPVVLIPDASLHDLPWEALQDPASGNFLLEMFEISHASSISAYARLSTRPTSVFKRPLLAYAASGKALPGRISSVSPDLFQPQKGLPITSELDLSNELKALSDDPQKLWLRSGLEASKSRFLLELNAGAPRFLHIAAHAKSNATSPLGSSIYFHPGEEDSILRPRDIRKISIPSELVVVSSCESSLGVRTRASGVHSLSNAFLSAGARRVISSLWRVDDRATSELMQLLYSRLRAGRLPAEALRDAKLAFLKRTVDRHPFFWSAFVLTGAR